MHSAVLLKAGKDEGHLIPTLNVTYHSGTSFKEERELRKQAVISVVRSTLANNM